jgi:O-antigen/teichoic acid export membrane protein
VSAGPTAGTSGRRPPDRVLVNASANVVGQAVAVLAGVVCVPIYLHLLGAEAIGLIGFSLALQAIVRMLDLGMSSAVVRQVARLADRSTHAGELAEFYVTFERLFAAAAAGIAVVTLSLSPLVAAHWLHGQQLPHRQVTLAVAAISLQSAVLFMGALYQGVLMGLERQVRFNRIRVVETTASQVGAVLLLSFWTARVEVLFGWQLAIALAALIAYRRGAVRSLPAGRAAARFRFAHVRAVWIFAVGMAGITTTGTILANMDKVLLSRWLRLGSFGYYTLAFYGASLVGGLLVAPVFNALFPRTCALVERGDAAGERRLYHVAVQGLITMVWPVAAILWVFARPVLQVWIGDPGAVAAAAAVLPYLVAGVALNTLMVPAYMLQLAHAWTTLGLTLNLVLIAVFAPLLFVLTTRWGLAGAAINFALMQGVYLLVGLPLTHLRLLRDAFREVVLRDLLPGIALCVAGAAALTAVRDAVVASAPVARYALIIIAWIALAAGTALVSPRVRPALRRGWAPFSGL